MHFWLDSVLPKLRGGYYEPSYVFFKNFPVSNITNSKIIEAVKSVLNLNKQMENVKLETQRNQIHHAITHTEKKIDAYVYELYDLNEKEIELVEQI
ncbi:MAG: hypothetical protein DRI69_00950 [Bacteroidetes bacterium]|nr:MAG: hypothetical protein DRI69_00950 [Bacteroidota bacterium]